MDVAELMATMEHLESRLARLEKYFPSPARGARKKRNKGSVAVNDYMKKIRSHSITSKSK